jgi:Rv2175c C-terminal domain of unknown function
MVSERAEGGRQASVTQTHPVATIEIDRHTDDLVGEWLTLPEVADRLGLTLSRAKQLVRTHKLLGFHRGPGGPMVPALFIKDGQVLKGLSGTLTVLMDAGYEDTATLRWLFTADDSLPGTPVQALIEDRRTEINRRAQALAF